MEMVLSNGFCEMSQAEVNNVNGGYKGWQGGMCSLGGALLVSCSVPVLFANPGAGLTIMGAGFALMDLDEN